MCFVFHTHDLTFDHFEHLDIGTGLEGGIINNSYELLTYPDQDFLR